LLPQFFAGQAVEIPQVQFTVQLNAIFVGFQAALRNYQKKKFHNKVLPLSLIKIIVDIAQSASSGDSS